MMNEWIISSSLLIAAVLLGRWLLRGRISLRLQYALWAVVLLRLLLPFQLFTSDFGAGTMARTVDISEPVRQVYASAREDDYEQAYDAAYRQVLAEYESGNRTYAPADVEREAAAQAKAAIELDLNKLLWGLWFAGMVVMTSVIVSCNVHLGLHLKRRRRELPVSDSLLPVYVTEAVPTPCIFGLFHPAIYLTPEAAGDERVRSHVLAHELTHYRHWDHIWSVLRSLCLILHWYNPLVWMAAKVSRADAELACDEGALAKLGEDQRGDYGRTLIGLTCQDNGGSMFVTATTMTGSAGSIRERIRLLMKRPRNTVLALTAVVLIGTIIVGCSFAGAPETTEPVESTEPTGHTPDNNMSYQGQELPIPENPGGTTETVDQASEVAALFGPDGDPWYLSALAATYANAYSDFDPAAFFSAGQNAVTLDDEEKALITEVYGADAVDKTVFRMTWPLVDRTLAKYVGADSSYMDMSEFLFCPETEAYLLVREDVPGRRLPEILSLDVLGDDQVRMIYRFYGEEQQYAATLIKDERWKVYSNQPVITASTDTRDLDGEIRALFTEDADPSYRAALTRLYEYLEEPITYSEEDLFVPEITEIIVERSDAAVVLYRRPGDFRRYAAQLYHNDTDGWYVFGNRMVVTMDDYAGLNPRALTEQEMAQFRSVFNTLNADGEINPAACFLVNYYEDVTRMQRRDFMAYFPGSTEGTEREFELLKEKYPDFFEGWTWENMPIPVHCYETKALNSVLQKYADIRWEDLADDGTHYLEETGCWYNYTSDFGLGGFYARSGFVYDGGAVILGDWSALIFVERSGEYFVQAHVPTYYPASTN